MLSDDLQNIAELFSAYAGIGMVMPARQVQGLVAQLNKMTARAHELERHVVPEAVRQVEHHDHDNVLSLDMARRRQALTRLAEGSST
jgi:hypothetical protein